MTAARRYAVYYAPEAADPLSDLGSLWLGRDAATGETLAQPEVPGFTSEELSALTAAPRRYGLHATLKAPVFLAKGRNEAEFLAAVAAWAARETPFDLPGLTVGSIGGFVALVPNAACPPLHAMAARCVEALDPFRAPPSAAETARRNADRLPPRERMYLCEWGYPYVFDAYRFHITLSDGIADAARREAFRAAAAIWFASVTERPVAVREACVFVQDQADKPFFLTHRFKFGS